RRQGRPTGEDLPERHHVELARHDRLGQQRLDIGPEDQPPARLGVEEGPDAQAVARQQELPAAAVPERERELAVQLVDAGRPLLLVQVEDRLAIGTGAKAMAAALELSAQLDVVEDLAVADQPQRFVFVRERLQPPLQVDDAQAGMAETDAVVDVEPGRFRPAVADGGNHRLQCGGRRSATATPLEEAGYATHRVNSAPIRCLSTLPFAVRGSSGAMLTCFGCMKSSSVRAQWARTSRSVSSTPSRGTTTSRMAWPSRGSGTPTTAASATPASWQTAASTSRGLTFSPRL